MRTGPTQKRMCNPAGIPDAKFFAERKRRRKKAQRSEPLPGTKRTLSSQDDGQLEQLFTAHDSTTIPKPLGGRKLVTGSGDGQLAGLLEQSRQTLSSPMAKTMGWVSIALATLLLVLVYSTAYVKVPDFVLVVGFLGFIAMHVCVLFSQLNSDGRNGLGIVALAIFYPGYVIWCLIGGLL